MRQPSRKTKTDPRIQALAARVAQARAAAGLAPPTVVLRVYPSDPPTRPRPTSSSSSAGFPRLSSSACASAGSARVWLLGKRAKAERRRRLTVELPPPPGHQLGTDPHPGGGTTSPSLRASARGREPAAKECNEAAPSWAR